MIYSFMKFGWNSVHFKRFDRRRSIWCILGVVLILSLAGRASATTPRAGAMTPPYILIRQKIDTELCYEKRSLIDWAAELHEKEPKTVKEALVKIDIMLRAGLDNEVTKTTGQLRSLYPDVKNQEAQNNTITLVQVCLNSYKKPELTTMIIENLAETIMDRSLRSVLLPLFRRLREKGWDEEKIDEWIAKQQDKAAKTRTLSSDIPRYYLSDPSYKSNLWKIRHDERPGTVWAMARLNNYKNNHEKYALLDQLDKEIRKPPIDTLKILDFLLIWEKVPAYNQHVKPDPAWIAELAQPKTSLEAYYLGKQLADLQQWKPAGKLLQKAVDLLEEQEKEKSAKPSEKPLDRGTVGNRSYRSALHQLLRKCNGHLKPDSKSKKHDRVSPATNRPTSSSTAASTSMDNTDEGIHKQEAQEMAKRQKAEQEILEQEKTSKNDPEYWLRRAEFYLGVTYPKMTEKDVQKAGRAFEKGIELTGPKSSPENQKKYATVRKTLFLKYTTLLREANRCEKMVEILLEELQSGTNSNLPDIISQYAQCQGGLDYLEPDEPIVWNWLEKQKKWNSLENRVLDLMARRAQECAEKLPASPNNEAPHVVYDFVNRVEKMAKEGDLSRMEYYSRMLLGSTMLGIKPNPERLVPLLEAKFKQKDNSEIQRRNLATNLFHAYLNSGYVKEADELFKEPSFQLRARNRFQELARMAAFRGDKDVAMRNWRRSANYGLKDPLQTNLNESFRKFGLGDKIDAYYADVKKKLPGFVPPEKK